MSNFSKPIKTDAPLVIAYPSSGPDEGYAVLHAVGCSHANRGRFDSQPAAADLSTDDGFDDDWYMVAPCARA
jgi:hypothetical protein